MKSKLIIKKKKRKQLKTEEKNINTKVQVYNKNNFATIVSRSRAYVTSSIEPRQTGFNRKNNIKKKKNE